MRTTERKRSPELKLRKHLALHACATHSVPRVPSQRRHRPRPERAPAYTGLSTRVTGVLVPVVREPGVLAFLSQLMGEGGEPVRARVLVLSGCVKSATRLR